MADQSEPRSRVALALRDLSSSRPARAVRALLLRASDARDAILKPLTRKAPETAVERVRGLDSVVTVARDDRGVPGVFAGTLADVAFGMGWACADDRLFQIELMRRALSGELAATFGDRPVDVRTTTRMMAGRTFVDLDAFTRAMDFRGAAEASWSIASAEARTWVDAFAAGINAYVASGRRPLEMLLLDLEPRAFTGADAFLVAKGLAFQLSFSYRFALAWALVASSVDPARAARLRPVAHPLTVTRGDLERLAPLLATTEELRAVLGSDGLHLGSNAFAVAPSRSKTGRAMVASDPHMPLTAPSCFWEVRVRGGGLDARGVCVPGFPGIVIGQNAHAAWGVTAGWGDDTQIYRENVGALRREGALKSRRESIAIRGGGSRTIDVLETPRGPVVSHAIGGEVLEGNGESTALSLRWSGRDATLDADAALKLMRVKSFDDLREAARDHGGPTLNYVFANDRGQIGWTYAGRVPKRSSGVSGLDILDGDDPRGAWHGYIPPSELPHVVDPRDGIVVSANTRPHGDGYPYSIGELFEPPYRAARIRALLDRFGKIDVRDALAIQRDVHSAWALSVRDALLEGLDDESLALAPRRGREVIARMRAWNGRATEDSIGATATYAFLEAVIRHVFLDDLGELAFERYFEIMNVTALPLLRILGGERDAWLEGRDRATIVRDAAAMAEGRLRRWRGEDPSLWRWGDVHTITFHHAFGDVPGLRAIASPGPYAARGDGTTVCMGEYDLRGGGFAVRTAPAFRTVMVAAAPEEGGAVLPPGQSGDPASRFYRDQTRLYFAGELGPLAWDETAFTGKRTRLVP